MLLRPLFAVALLTLLPPMPLRADAQTPAKNGGGINRTSSQWQTDTQADVIAADRLIRSVYPAWVDPTNPGFRSRWMHAVATAKQRAALVRSDAGHRAVLRALENAVADPHVGFGGTPSGGRTIWAGIGLEQRGNRYLATNVDPDRTAHERVPLGDAEFLGCDGLDAETTLRRHLDGWATVWDVPGNRSRYATSLFVDQDNPFVARPRRCSFRTASRRPVTIALRWREAQREAVSQALQPFRRVRPVTDMIALRYADDGAAWFTIGNFGLESAHAALRERIARERQTILSRPYVVFDLRGNQGGNSTLADALIETVWGAGTVPAGFPIGAKQWRASAEVIEASRALRKRVSQWADVPTRVIAAIDTMIPRLEAAMAAGQPFYTEDAALNVPAANYSTRAAVPLSMPIYVLTDGDCTSSCIVAVNAFRRIGAVQVGDPTERQTRYVEAWFQHALPSGLGTVILPIAVVPWPDSDLGGQPVDLAWTGAANDDDGLRKFIAADAAHRR